MKIPKLLKQHSIEKDKSPYELVKLAKAFHLAHKPIGAIVELLEANILDKETKLTNTEQIYTKATRPDLYIASLLAQREVLLKLHDLLTTYVEDESYIDDKDI